MTRLGDRREFIRTVASVAVAPHVLQSTDAAASGRAARAAEYGATERSQPTEASKVYLEAFDYEGVSLLDGMLKKQVDEARNYFYAMEDDDILIGFRRRAGMH